MPTITVHLETPLHRSFRVEQVAGMFDVPVEERLRHALTAEVPGMDEEWTIGAIVGPSGSGKTTLAKAAFGGKLWKRRPWPRDKPLIDCFGDVPVKRLTLVLASVGLGSPPTWLKPYEVLSTGEKFRAELARAVVSGGILTQRHRGTEQAEVSGAGFSASTEYSVLSTADSQRRLVVFDEFTSSLDRVVAKTASAALSRLLRSFEPRGPRLVAVTCHDDILTWLSPDWTLKLAGNGTTPRLTRKRPAQPAIEINIDRVPQAMWTIFAPHHYLAGRMAASATCYAARWGEAAERRVDAAVNRPVHGPIAFCAVVAALGWKKTKRIARLVVLPEFQGMGVGGKLLNAVAGEEARKGNRVTITASHPAVLAHCSKSERWRLIGLKKNGSTRQRFEGREVGSSVGRAVVGFEWMGES